MKSVGNRGAVRAAGSILLIGAALVMAGCRGPAVVPVAQLPSVARAGEQLAPIELDRIVFNLQRGQEIGTYRGGGSYTGCGGSFSPEPINWWMGRVTVRDQDLNDVFGQEMRRAGYNVAGDPSQLFADMTSDAARASYLVGGRVEAVLMDVCDERSILDGRWLGIQSGEISLDVTWQVFSTLERRVVLETRSRGSASLTEGVPDGEVELLIRGIAAAAANLAADQRFHNLLASEPAPPTTISGVKSDWPPVSLRPVSAFEGGIAENMGRIQASVVTVRSGGAQGSGFFVASDLILTNEHVVGAVTRAKILLIDGRETYARVLRRDPVRDIALLQVDTGSYPALPLRRTPQPRLAEEVYAIGSPLSESLAGTVTRGIISQVKKDDQGQIFIQADVTVQPGSSGGPLLDAAGSVIGVAQSGLTDGADRSVGINFFIPIAEALQRLNLNQAN